MLVEIHKERLRCPRCDSPMMPAKSIQGQESSFWMRCTKKDCRTFVDTYIPLFHQFNMHYDNSPYVGIFGGYGSGKTVTSSKDDGKHIMITPYGETLIGADTLVQIQNTIKKDFETDFPEEFVEHYARQEKKITFVNGHILYYRPMNDEGNLRSMNISRAHFLEASETKHENFTQAETRLRNDAGVVYERDEKGDFVWEYNEKRKRWQKKVKVSTLKFIVESNPDAGWIRDEFLLKSGKICIYDDNRQNYVVTEPKKFVTSHIIPTHLNLHLPPDFEERNKEGKPRWWIERYLFGSFDYAEGMVYPEFMTSLVDDFPIPRHWKHAIAMDYGLNDNTHFVFGALDPKAEKPIMYLYKEIVINGRNIREIAEVYKQHLKQIPRGGLLFTPVMDARSFSLRQKTGELKTLGSLLLDENLVFDPAQMDLESRIMRTNTLLEKGQLKIFKSLYKLIEEGKIYKFPDKKLHGTSSDADNKPVDKNNHGMNAMEFLCMELPRNMVHTNLGAYYAGKNISAIREQERKRVQQEINPLFPMLSQPEQSTGYDDFQSFYGGGDW